MNLVQLHLMLYHVQSYTLDSTITCGPGSYGINYYQDGIGKSLILELKNWVNIIDSTPGSISYGMSPDTI